MNKDRLFHYFHNTYNFIYIVILDQTKPHIRFASLRAIVSTNYFGLRESVLQAESDSECKGNS